MLKVSLTYHTPLQSGLARSKRLHRSSETTSDDSSSDFYAELGDAIREDLKEYIQSTQSKGTTNGTR